MSEKEKQAEQESQQRRGILARLFGKKAPSTCCGVRIEEMEKETSSCCGVRIEEVVEQEAKNEASSCCGVRIEEVKEGVEEAKATKEK